jgi:hypothetical protein
MTTPLNLIDLEPQFILYQTNIESREFVVGDQATWRDRGCPTEIRELPTERRIYIDDFRQAQGILFLCPTCFVTKGSKIGCHMVEVTFNGRGVEDCEGSHNIAGNPVRWNVSGDSYENLTLSPSIMGCNWHGHVANGKVTFE